MPYARACEKQVISCILVADGAKNGQQGEDSLEVEPLVSRERVMWLRSVWASRLGEALAKTEDLSKPERCVGLVWVDYYIGMCDSASR